MPFTLYRYILRELLKVLILSSAVMVCVISFAVAVKPLAEGMLSPGRLITYVIAVAPTLLVFIIPFCGAFAGTVVFHRMASENEVLACSASGMSYRAILLPVVFLGGLLTLLLFLMSNLILPKLQHYSAAIVEKDVASMIVDRINSGNAVPVSQTTGVVLYADHAEEREPTEAMKKWKLPPRQWLMLKGIAVGNRKGKDQHLRADGTAETAHALIFEHEGDRIVKLHLNNVSYFDHLEGRTVFSQTAELPPVRIPNALGDKAQFKSCFDLWEWEREPYRYDEVRQVSEELIAMIRRTQLLDTIHQRLQPNHTDRFTLIDPFSGENMVITAPKVNRHDKFLVLRETPGQRVRIQVYRDNLPTKRIEAAKAVLSVSVALPNEDPTVNLEMTDVEINSYEASKKNLRDVHEESGRLVDDGLTDAPNITESEKLIQMGAEMGTRLKAQQPTAFKKEGRALHSRSIHLDRGIKELYRRIEAQLHERAALACCCLLTLLLGSVLSIRLRHSMPLVVFFWAFLLTIVALLITYNGSNFTNDINMNVFVGLSITWTGVVVLFGVVGFSYYRMAKN